jgi:uncharacterized membrane protein YgcG
MSKLGRTVRELMASPVTKAVISWIGLSALGGIVDVYGKLPAWVVGLFRPLMKAVVTPAGERPVLGALKPTALGRCVIGVGAAVVLLVVLLGVFFGARAWTRLNASVRARVLKYHLAPMRSVFKWLTTNPPPLQYSDLEYETRTWVRSTWRRRSATRSRRGRTRSSRWGSGGGGGRRRRTGWRR